MPYINQDARYRLSEEGACPQNVGELNYLITLLCKDFIEQEDASYAVYNSVIGVLECAKLEMYRRAVAPYENLKMMQNGDV